MGQLDVPADGLLVERIGPEHQAGSDSLLTQATFYKLLSCFFEDQIDDKKFENVLHGLGRGCESGGRGDGAAKGAVKA